MCKYAREAIQYSFVDFVLYVVLAVLLYVVFFKTYFAASSKRRRRRANRRLLASYLPPMLIVNLGGTAILFTTILGRRIEKRGAMGQRDPVL